MTSSVLDTLRGTIVVSCQADPGLPLDDPKHIAALARSVILGGATGVRIQGRDNIAAVRAATDLPLIGLIKADQPGSDVYITPTLSDVAAVIAAGADVVAFDATSRPRPESVASLCAATRQAGRLSMADVSTASEAVAAMEAGADVVSTTMSGYTPYSRQQQTADFELMAELARLGVPFAAEGRIWSGAEARRCLDLGAAFVVVGGAITRPDAITRRFIEEAAPTPSLKLAGRPSR
ncbi:N-acetylmannosamine-6-phosphate 2-epimerase [Lichenihabitans sp. Uapishka_5]|uniref:N-acetylmannosamine-6-phosphate 2-epimerase n=1 Tax=Lichenihabitans sp. Uapishka_5 TaxID=3037302 RepID=UPI0029E7E438|nr:N-acetylmannosamine-6-phosphate 2-epimerase [Lichenihabitans sp. Uapishka_5]MDX7951346.1 N-acetylmannosamine-6-phosphate 2-epimerase [Lichenihabitans sp. Uapishka_5]